jgi:hypothetical protein
MRLNEEVESVEEEEGGTVVANLESKKRISDGAHSCMPSDAQGISTS